TAERLPRLGHPVAPGGLLAVGWLWLFRGLLLCRNRRRRRHSRRNSRRRGGLGQILVRVDLRRCGLQRLLALLLLLRELGERGLLRKRQAGTETQPERLAKRSNPSYGFHLLLCRFYQDLYSLL